MQSNDARLLEWVSRQLLGGRRLFVSGGAGSGKTTFVKHLLPKLLEKLARGPSAEDELVVVAASTGLAATHLAGVVESLGSDRVVGPFTLHRAAMIPRSCDPDRPESVRRGQQDLADARVVIVDEISMTDQTTFDRFMLRLSEHTGVLVVGDFHQLPPVDRDADGHPAYAFKSPAFKAFELIELEGNHRQSEPEFAQHVERLRRGVSNPSFYADVSREFDLRYPVLFGTNDGADAHNEAEFDKIKGRKRTSRACVEVGTPGRALSWLAKETRALRRLDLKKTMRVICVRNHNTSEGETVANGEVGTVTRIGPMNDAGYVESVEVVFDRRGSRPRTISAILFKQLRWRNGREEVVCSVRQLPLRPAYGLTVHKAQGMTLHVANIEGSRVNFAHGHAYVAVSRCSTKSGLRVLNHRAMRVFASPAVERYYEQAVRVSPSVLDGIRVTAPTRHTHVDDTSGTVEHAHSDPRSVSETNGTPECFADSDLAGNRQSQDDGTGSLWSIVKAFGIMVVFVVLVVLLAAILFS